MLVSLRLSRAFQYNIQRNLTGLKPYSTKKVESTSLITQDEYTEVAQYPRIIPEAELLRKDEIDWHNKIKRQKTVEEKLFEINMPRYWGWKCLLLNEGEIPYNSLEFTKFITRTHLIECKEFPTHQEHSERASELAGKLKAQVEDVLSDTLTVRHAYTFKNLDTFDAEKEFTTILVNHLNRLFLKAFHEENPVLRTVQVDYSPRIEAFWNFGNLCETYERESSQFGLPPDEIPEEYLERPSNKYIQYIGKPILQMRTQDPLPSIVNPDQALCSQYPVPHYGYDPFVTFGYEMVRRHVTNIPGFWPGESREFSLMSYHHSNYLKYRPASYGASDAEETLQCQGILASFAWLMSLASYQGMWFSSIYSHLKIELMSILITFQPVLGFTTFHDNTYPFLTQTVLTDGMDFSFVLYQLNTTELHHEDISTNPKSNICWITPRMRLYDLVNGKVEGVNENVLKFLIQFYMNQPKKIENPKPFLDENLGVIAKYNDPEKRTWLESRFKHFSSNRPRHRYDIRYL
ncbi:UNVERIFIED_CONTAM: hypothetical protein PYX00_008654 [Menopon gallinae]|uniref:Mitochondrial ribosomal protein S30 n=1 Tax=Menopon gallinae TaxID=328185 RepID=A0AAW2HPP2_9NEOP